MFTMAYVCICLTLAVIAGAIVLAILLHGCFSQKVYTKGSKKTKKFKVSFRYKKEGEQNIEVQVPVHAINKVEAIIAAVKFLKHTHGAKQITNVVNFTDIKVTEEK